MTTALTPGRPGAAAGLAAPPCICCGSGRWEPHFRVLRRCLDCGFVRADLDLTDEQDGEPSDAIQDGEVPRALGRGYAVLGRLGEGERRHSETFS
jgi:hypothetical protein